MKYKGSYSTAVRRLNVTPLPTIPKPLPPPPETREAALIRLGELEQEIIRGKSDSRYASSNAIAEKMQIQTLLSTTLKRRPMSKAKPERPTFKPRNARLPYVGPRCDFCGSEAPEGVCLNLDSIEWPHPKV